MAEIKNDKITKSKTAIKNQIGNKKMYAESVASEIIKQMGEFANIIIRITDDKKVKISYY